MYEIDSNVKLIVRIRNTKDESSKNEDTTSSSRGIKTPKANRATQNTRQLTKSPAINKSKINHHVINFRTKRG